MNQYDNPEFSAAYAQMSRSQFGLEGAGEWHQLKPMFPDLKGKSVLDLGCGYGWHCKYAVEQGAASVLGIDRQYKSTPSGACRIEITLNVFVDINRARFTNEKVKFVLNIYEQVFYNQQYRDEGGTYLNSKSGRLCALFLIQ